MNRTDNFHRKSVSRVSSLTLVFNSLRDVFVIAVAVPLLIGATAEAQDVPAESFTLEQIIDGIQQSLDRFACIRMRYACSSWMWLENRHVPVKIEAVYAHKRKDSNEKMMQYFDVNVYRLDPNSGAKSIVESRQVAFDGLVTRELIRVKHPAVRRSREMMEGLIRKGFISGKFVFGGGDFGPFREVWYLGAKPLASALKSSGISYRVAGRTVSDGLETVIIEGLIPRKQDDPNSREVCYRFWICPERGFLPIRRTFVRDGQMWFQRGLHDLDRLTNDAWFPRRICFPADRSEVATAKMAWVWEIEEISLDPVPDSFFSFEFPAGTRVYDEVEGINYTTY